MLAARALVLALVLMFSGSLEHVDSYLQSISTYYHRQSLQQRSCRRQSLQQSLQQRSCRRQTSPQMLPRIMRQGKADCQYIDSPANLPATMQLSFESSILSRCASVGFYRREKLQVDEETRSKLKESGILTKEFVERFNQVVLAACEEYYKECATRQNDPLKISRMESKRIDPATISEYQADMCLIFDYDTDLQTIFKDVVVNPAQDVRIFGKHGVSSEDLQIMKEEYICFEITEEPGKIFDSEAVPGQSAIQCIEG